VRICVTSMILRVRCLKIGVNFIYQICSAPMFSGLILELEHLDVHFNKYPFHCMKILITEWLWVRRMDRAERLNWKTLGP
jgi:hypothetical protein